MIASSGLGENSPCWLRIVPSLPVIALALLEACRVRSWTLRNRATVVA